MKSAAFVTHVSSRLKELEIVETVDALGAVGKNIFRLTPLIGDQCDTVLCRLSQIQEKLISNQKLSPDPSVYLESNNLAASTIGMGSAVKEIQE